MQKPMFIQCSNVNGSIFKIDLEISQIVKSKRS